MSEEGTRKIKSRPFPEGKGGSNDAPSVVVDAAQSNLTGPSLSSSPKRTVVFVDYQNMYRSAREAFGWLSEGGHFGNFRPYGFARQMVRPLDRALSQVRVYTGIHTPQRNGAQNANMQRRMRAWIAEAPDKVQLFPRPLRYSKKRPGGEEKGVDVELAIHMVSLALDDAFDVVVLASMDTDLVPPLQLIADRYPEKRIVTAGFEPIDGCDTGAPLDLAGHDIQRVRIGKRDFDRMADKRNFYLSASEVAIDQGRWTKLKNRFEP